MALDFKPRNLALLPVIVKDYGTLANLLAAATKYPQLPQLPGFPAIWLVIASNWPEFEFLMKIFAEQGRGWPIPDAGKSCAAPVGQVVSAKKPCQNPPIGSLARKEP